ncbi:hypothetical protein BDM02DRAFT_978122 [Thelephora ganbajun]|uniref:Uncharacterized protein n=1 Tax=Thelephora ganbajun TaxID=370292 RepID=A0ACB6ZNX2_THEGA|nr:hypothetical protein BDM02DRAFT_978122 [Thelephora ganbajun]
MPVYLTSLEDPITVDNVLAFLEPYVPYTLGLIGNIANSRPELVKAIKVYTSFEVDFSKAFHDQPRYAIPTSSTGAEPGSNEGSFSPPALFSIIALQPREQTRFFCSADLKGLEAATPEEEAHVQEFFKEVIPIVAAFPPDNEDGPTPEYDIDPVGVKGRGYHVGRVHEKWIPCLDPITIQRTGPLVCLTRPPPPPPPPQGASTSSTPLTTGTGETPDRWIISQFSLSDIDFIKSTSSIPRHKAYLESRTHTSISIRDRNCLTDVNAVGTSTDSNPVAWSIIQADGSFGVLWVEPSHRGLGLGDLVLNECVSRLETYHGFSGNKVTGTGILGWQWADVSPANARSVQFFSRQEGWKIGWGTQWISFDPDADPATIDWSYRQAPTEESRRQDWGKNPRILLRRKDSNVSN